MRKHVKPALPLAVILDPERGRKLPPQGTFVAWSHYWEMLLARGDVVVAVDESDEAASVAPAADPVDAGPAEIADAPPAEPELHA